jgi:hypothetical protein
MEEVGFDELVEASLPEAQIICAKADKIEHNISRFS